MNEAPVASLPWVVLGVPSSKRTQGLQLARARLGLAPARLVPWREWMASPRVLDDQLREPCVFKIEPPGDDEQVHHRLLTWGSQHIGHTSPAPLAFGELGAGDVWFQGFSLAMRQLESSLQGIPHVQVVNAPVDILAMTDKWQCQERLQAQGINTPARLGLVSSYDDFLALLDQHQLDRAFLKARYGSSAAGVVAYRRNRRGMEQATTSAQLVSSDVKLQSGKPARAQLFNVKRLQTYSSAAAIRQVIDLIAAQGAYAEAWIPKPRSGAGHFDVRVVTLAGQARHRVARIGLRPMTNLHLDSQRADCAVLLSRADIGLLEATAEQAARAFANSHIIGLDMVVRPGSAQVLEANAFGDLLPGLLWDGKDTYEAASSCL
ncbi:MAG: hypothetical protein HEQ39_16145 [Rhizobacter sp.]